MSLTIGGMLFLVIAWGKIAFAVCVLLGPSA